MNLIRISRRVAAVSILAAGVGAAQIARAQVVRQLTDVKTGAATVAAMDDNGTEVFVSSSTNQLGTNASQAFQLVRFTASTGVGAQLTTATDGIGNGRFTVSVSDDDQWVAFLSFDNPTAQNLDRSGEVFVMKRDGTNLQQLTNHPGAGTGEPSVVAMAGGGTKIAFVSTGDLTGGNAGHHAQVFLINRDGTGLSQVTSLAGGDIGFLGISDDATKIAFGASADPLGTNADGNVEVFAINADSTGLKQLTSTTDRDIESPAVTWMSFAGGASKIAFAGYGNPLGTNSDGNAEIFVVDYAGTNLRQLTNVNSPIGSIESNYPGITDDGATVYFTSNLVTVTQNHDGSYDLWKIGSNGTGLAVLTSNGIRYADLVVSGSGNRIAFRDSNGDGETKVIDTTGANLRTLTSTTRFGVQEASTDANATLVAFSSTADMLPPGNMGHTTALFTMRADGTGLAQLTSFNVYSPSLTRDAHLIVFDSNVNPTGQNPSASGQLFRINPDGTALTQVTRLTNGAFASYAVASRDGSVMAFSSNSNDTGQNPSLGEQVFKINGDGTGFAQLTQAPGSDAYSSTPSIDDAGVWIAFASNANLDGAHPNGTLDIYRMRSDGSGLQSITNGGPSGTAGYPSISGDGSTICFDSTYDLTGGNADHSKEIFVWQGGPLRQLTSGSGTDSDACVLSDDGQWAVFSSDSPLIDANPLRHFAIYRANVSTGAIERIDGLGFGPQHDSPAGLIGGSMSVDGTGAHVVINSNTNPTRGNPDLFPEVIIFDRVAAPLLSVSSGPAPTRVSWDVESGPVRYDVVRGDVANLRINGSAIDLGTVACVKNDSPVNSTEGSDDTLTPAPGHAFFYVYRGSQGLSAGPGSYGQGTGGKERLAGPGDCAP